MAPPVRQRGLHDAERLLQIAMANSPDDPCRTALVDALALLDRHGHPGAACYVAMALDSLDESGGGIEADAPPALRIASRRSD